MNYHLDRQAVFKNKTPKQKPWARLFLVLILILSLWWLGPWLFSGLADRVTSLTFPGLSLGGRISSQFNYLLADITSAGQSRQSNLALKQELVKQELVNQKLRQNLLNYQELLYQFKALENEASGFGRVLIGPGHLNHDILLIGLEGERIDGAIKPGQEVRVADYLTLGQVVSLGNRVARVKMYSSPNTYLRATIGPEKIPVVLIGQGQSGWLTKLPEAIEIDLGSKVMLATEADRFLGVVKEIKVKPEEASQDIYIQLPFNFYELNWVEFYDL